MSRSPLDAARDGRPEDELAETIKADAKSMPTEPDWNYASASAERTRELGREIGAALAGGEVILLEGELGAGKTCLAGGVAEGLEIAEPAISPTYVIHREYVSPRGLTLHHLDFYRLEGQDARDTIGIDELVGPACAVLVEWPRHCPDSFAQFSLELRFAITGDDARRIEGRWGSGAFSREDLVARVLALDARSV